MLHSVYRINDFEYDSTNDCTGKDHYYFSIKKFYAIADLAKDGFIHEDGSLRFEFKIKKHNLLRKLELAEAEI